MVEKKNIFVPYSLTKLKSAGTLWKHLITHFLSVVTFQWHGCMLYIFMTYFRLMMYIITYLQAIFIEKCLSNLKYFLKWYLSFLAEYFNSFSLESLRTWLRDTLQGLPSVPRYLAKWRVLLLLTLLVQL